MKQRILACFIRAGFMIVKGDDWIRAQREKVLPHPWCVHSATPPPKVEAGFNELKKIAVSHQAIRTHRIKESIN